MARNITFQQITDELIRVFGNKEKKDEYYRGTGAQFSLFTGPFGNMSPANRVAYIQEFGTETTEKAEAEALRIISDKKAEYSETNHARYVKEADSNESEAFGYIPKEGDFVWAVQSCMKNDGSGLRGEIADILECEEEKQKKKILCKIEKVFRVTKEKLEDNHTANMLVQDYVKNGEDFPGGAQSDDDSYKDLYDEYLTFFTLTAAVIDESGRWFLIDSEKCDYARYLLLPFGFQSMFSNIIEDIEKDKQMRLEEERLEDERQVEEYTKRCEKWEDVMTDVSPLIEKRSILNEKFRKTSYRQPEYEKIKKECSAVDREILTVQKRNISAMVKKAFPGLKHTVRKGSGYRYDFEVEYIDGPTEDEFIEKTDFGLFVGIYTYFDGMTDSTNYSRAKYTDFAKKYIGDCDSSEVEVIRRCNPETTNRIANEIEEMFPELKDRGERDFTISEVQSIATRLGCDTDNLQRRIDGYRSLTSNDVAIKAWHSMSFYNNVDNRQKEYGGEENKESKESEFAVIDYNERCIAVTGDTKPLSGKLKKIGMYNSRLSCGPGWVFSKKNKDKLKEADKLLGGVISKKFPELLK